MTTIPAEWITPVAEAIGNAMITRQSTEAIAKAALEALTGTGLELADVEGRPRTVDNSNRDDVMTAGIDDQIEQSARRIRDELERDGLIAESGIAADAFRRHARRIAEAERERIIAIARNAGAVHLIRCDCTEHDHYAPFADLIKAGGMTNSSSADLAQRYADVLGWKP